MNLLFVGNPGGTNIADSFLHAARQMRIESTLVPVASAFRANPLQRLVSWHLLGHKPPHLAGFSRRVVENCRAVNATHLIATGLAPIDAESLRQIEAKKIVYLTDDPWNPDFTASWFMDAVLEYDVVYTTRRSNTRDLRSLGCQCIEYLPFGYDPRHFHPEPRPLEHDVFFAGGAEQDRVDFLKPLLDGTLKVALAGDRWDKYAETQGYYRGHLDPQNLLYAITGARVNPCLVRSSNRDGHVMRSFEVPASGACMVAQDTDEHREILKDTVLYFSTPSELRQQVDRLLKDESLRTTLAASSHHLITTSSHTYKDRLNHILGS